MELSNHRGFRNSGDYCKAFFIARSRPGPVLIDITKKCAIWRNVNSAYKKNAPY
jgi:hypothetical protein